MAVHKDTGVLKTLRNAAMRAFSTLLVSVVQMQARPPSLFLNTYRCPQVKAPWVVADVL